MQRNFIPKEFPYIKQGDIYGRLTVVQTYVQEGTYRYMAECDCACGEKGIFVRIDGLRSKTKPARSCGCYHKDQVTTHGAWGQPLFFVWRNMMARCYDPSNKRYSRYGGRGISVCERWHNPHNFFEDMSPTYSENLTIDRINNDSSYSPDNCRWATSEQQNRNKSNTTKITFDGKTMSITEWAEYLGISMGTLWDRINVRKWPIEKCLSLPIMTHKESSLVARNVRYGKS